MEKKEIELLKKCYDSYKIMLNDNYEKERLLKEIMLSFNEIEVNAHVYSLSVDPSGEDWKKVSDKHVLRNTVYRALMENVLTAEEIESILVRYNADGSYISQLKHGVSEFMISLRNYLIKKNKVVNDAALKRFERNININLEKYHEVLKSRRVKPVYDPRPIICGFLGSDFKTIYEYGEANNISEGLCDKAVNAIKDVDENMYNAYNERANSVIDEENKMLATCFYDIMSAIRNNDFDVIDYYAAYGDIDIKLRRNASRFLTVEEIKLFKPIIGDRLRNRDNKLSYERLLNSSLSIGGRVISFEEKKYVLDTLVSKNVPVNERIFSLGVRKFILKEKTIIKK